MIPLIFVGASLALLIGFFALTQYEAATGRRFIAAKRTAFDAFVDRMAYIYTHVDLAEFVRDEVRHLAGRAGHAVLEIVLKIVRAVERVLTRMMRYFRAHPDVDVAPRETAREFVRTLSDFKEELRTTPREISDI